MYSSSAHSQMMFAFKSLFVAIHVVSTINSTEQQFVEFGLINCLMPFNCIFFLFLQDYLFFLRSTMMHFFEFEIFFESTCCNHTQRQKLPNEDNDNLAIHKQSLTNTCPLPKTTIRSIKDLSTNVNFK